jgi:hypothetical protein
MNHLDHVISVCCLRDIELWKLCAKHVNTFVSSSHYSVIVPDKDTSSFERASPPNFNIIPESTFCRDYYHLLYDRIKNINLGRFGWYLQQFIKLSAIEHFNDKNILIWDADTIPLRHLRFFSDNGEPIFYLSNEYNLPYFQAIDKILGLDKITPKSFISQNMPIPSDWGRSCLRKIENLHQCHWFEALLKKIDFGQQSGFSEYETLGTFFTHYYNSSVKYQLTPWERRGFHNLKCIPTNSSQLEGNAFRNFDYVAFEVWDGLSLQNTTLSTKMVRNLWKFAGIVRRRILNRRKKRIIYRFLTKCFRSKSTLSILKVGATNGQQNDALGKFLRKKGNYRARLVEPIPEYSKSLKTLYSDRPDIEIIEAAAGEEDGELSLYYIPEEIALQMNGNGPQNHWAKGKASFSKAQIVSWIWQNCFRGEEDYSRIQEWLTSIERLAVPIVRTDKLLHNDANPSSTVLLIEVQDFEHQVVRGIDHRYLPRWIILQQDTADFSASNYLRSIGYIPHLSGCNIIFERPTN